jgi:hypothetical protein
MANFSGSGQPWEADGTINTARFVKRTGAADFRCLQCTGSDVPDGISQEGSMYAPGLGTIYGGASTDTVAATKGYQLKVYTVGDVCKLQAGGAVANGNKLTSDASGQGVVATAGNWYGAEALGAAASGELVDVVVQFGKA